MIRIPVALAVFALTCTTITGFARNAESNAASSASPVIEITDVARFYKIYDAAGEQPTAAQLRTDYLDPGSDGLHRLAKLRNVTGVSIAKEIAKSPDIYSGAKRCMVVLPRVRERLQTAIDMFRRLYPEAVIAPITIAVGRGKPVGVTDASGVMIGLEALCAVTWLDPNVEDRFVHVIAHEYAHVQQAQEAPAIYNDKKPTVIEESLIEGAAEFIGEMISGQVAYPQFKTSTKGHEKKIETAFVRDEDRTDLSAWLYNGTMKKPGDLGYWVGYRIVKSYYQHAADKRAAFRDILQMTDPKAFLAKSGWHPGIRLR